MRKAFYAVLLTGLFLLMLSALVVTPETADGRSDVSQPADWKAVFRPVVSAILPDAADASASRSDGRIFLAALPLLLTGILLPAGVRDANGRVLTAVRYENSVYQLFRPEVAGG